MNRKSTMLSKFSSYICSQSQLSNIRDILTLTSITERIDMGNLIQRKIHVSQGILEIEKKLQDWLLEPNQPVVRSFTLRSLLDRKESDPDVRESRFEYFEERLGS